MNNSKYHFDIEQNTDEWYEIRRNRITASSAKVLLASHLTKTGKVASTSLEFAPGKFLNQGAITRAKELAASQLMREREINSWKLAQFDWGHEFEPDAVVEFELRTFTKYHQIGFVSNDRLGCSPDRINYGLKKGLEVKCPQKKNHLNYLLNPDLLYDEYKAQVQFSLMITGWSDWTIISYHPHFDDDCKLAIYKCKRDDLMINTMKEKSKLVLEYSDLIYNNLKRKMNGSAKK